MRGWLAIAALAVAFGIFVGWLAFHQGDRLRRAEAQARLNAKSATITDTANQNAARITTQSETMAHAVETAPGGDAPIPPAVRSGWAASIDGLRDGRPAHPAKSAR